MEDESIRFEAEPNSDLAKSFKMGRPRDTRYDDIVQKAYREQTAQRAVVREMQVDDVIRGLRRGAKHLGVSVSYTATRDSEDPTKFTIEFIAYPTHRRQKEGESE